MCLSAGYQLCLSGDRDDLTVQFWHFASTVRLNWADRLIYVLVIMRLVRSKAPPGLSPPPGNTELWNFIRSFLPLFKMKKLLTVKTEWVSFEEVQFRTTLTGREVLWCSCGLGDRSTRSQQTAHVRKLHKTKTMSNKTNLLTYNNNNNHTTKRCNTAGNNIKQKETEEDLHGCWQDIHSLLMCHLLRKLFTYTEDRSITLMGVPSRHFSQKLNISACGRVSLAHRDHVKLTNWI